jgi:hypothetical protein
VQQAYNFLDQDSNSLQENLRHCDDMEKVRAAWADQPSWLVCPVASRAGSIWGLVHMNARQIATYALVGPAVLIWR